MDAVSATTSSNTHPQAPPDILATPDILRDRLPGLLSLGDLINLDSWKAAFENDIFKAYLSKSPKDPAFTICNYGVASGLSFR